MIQVTVGTTTERKKVNYPGSTSIRTILDEQDVDYSASSIMIDGANLTASDMDKTLTDLGKTEKCMLIAVIKSSAAR